jgi:xanthine dehydrogenase accessory factor
VTVWRQLAATVAEHGAAALVSVHEAKGSVPREAGARMVVRPDGAFHGTIGGGQLEWQALAWARESLLNPGGPARFMEQALGPDLGQCCGGRVTMLIETFGAEHLKELETLARAETDDPLQVECRIENGRVRRTRCPLPLVGESREEGSGAFTSSPQGRGGRVASWRETHGTNLTPLVLFGAGHVGRALVLALAPLPFRVRWIDSRPEAFPSHIPANATPVLLPDPPADLAQAPADAFVMVMTHDHPLDLAITAAALQRGFPFVGLIGSATKRARFEKRLRELGLPPERIRSLTCPIGLPGIRGKEPAVIAAATVAQLLQVRDKGAFSRFPSEAYVPA